MIPSAEEFYFSYGLYQKSSFTEEDFESLFRLIFPIERLDLHCPYCHKETTFEAFPRREKKKGEFPNIDSPIYSFNDFKEQFEFKYFHHGRKFEINYTCQREAYAKHSIYFQMVIEHGSIMKIGQYPSVAELNKDETKAYQKVLPSEYYQELNKAIGLYSHGIGIGSFVYLRRIFERLIYDTYNDHKEEVGIDKSQFNSIPMNQKIETLKAYLPPTLVEKQAMYGVLSKGIHSLDEAKCNDFFPIVRAGIEFILDEKIVQLARKAKEAKFNKDFAAVVHKAKN